MKDLAREATANSWAMSRGCQMSSGYPGL